MKTLPSTAQIWFGVLGGALAFMVQFVCGVAFTFAQCNAPAGRWQLAVQSWQVGLALAGLVVGVAAGATSLRIYRQTRGVDNAAAQERLGLGSPPPVGRINFLATVGLLVNSLTIALMAMIAISAPVLPLCQQS